MSDHVIVAGGGGFVGSHLVEHLLSKGLRVTVLDDYSSGRRSNIAHIDDPNFESCTHDARNEWPAFDSVSYIFQLASRASPTDFEQYPVDIATTNAFGTEQALETARAHDATVVVASSSEVYGDPEVHPQSEEYPGKVSLTSERCPYDEGKRFAEALGRAYAWQHDVDVRFARIFNTYGPRMRPDDGRVIPTFVRQALSGDPLTVHGEGTQTRSFCFVSDLVTGLWKLATTPDLKAESVNLGTTDEITIESLATQISSLVDREPNIEYEPRSEADPDVRCPDVSRAEEKLEWEPEVELEEGLRRTIEHFRRVNHPSVNPR